MKESLHIHLDFRSGIPIYIQVMNHIKHLIAVEELVPGDQLPTVRQVAADLRVNFNTISRAYRLMDEEGLISTQHGRGTFILEPETDIESDALRREALELLTLQYLHDAEHLGFSPEGIRNIVAEFLEAWKSAGKPPAIT